MNCVAKLLVFLVLVAKLNCSRTFVFIKLSDRSPLILQNVVPGEFLWAVLTCRRAMSADVSMGCKTHPSGSSRGQQSSKGDYSSYRWLHSINQHPTPALVSALEERLHSSQCRLSGTGKCCQIICLSTQSSIFLQNYKHHMKLYESHCATLTFQQHPITHILENYISSYVVI